MAEVSWNQTPIVPHLPAKPVLVAGNFQPGMRVILTLAPLLLLCVCDLCNLCLPSRFSTVPIPHPRRHFCTRPVICQRDFDPIYEYYHEILILSYIFLTALIDIARTFIMDVKFITFDTCLDYLPEVSVVTKKEHGHFSLLYSSQFYIIFSSFIILEILQSFLCKLMIKTIIFNFNASVQSLLKLFTIYKNTFSKFKLFPYGSSNYWSSYPRTLRATLGPNLGVMGCWVQGLATAFFHFVTGTLILLVKMIFKESH